MRRGVGANAIALMIFAFLPVFLGLAARALFPGIEARDQVLPTLLLHGLPVWLGALALAAVFSAEVGACEAILFMLSTSLSKDLYKRIVNPAATPEQVLRVARIAAFIGGSAGMLLADLRRRRKSSTRCTCSIRSSAPRCWCRWSAACS